MSNQVCSLRTAEVFLFQEGSSLSNDQHCLVNRTSGTPEMRRILRVSGQVFPKHNHVWTFD